MKPMLNLSYETWSKVWVTSDTHFLHENIIKYCDRPFKDKEEMTEALITTWNEQVGDDDLVIHLGDVTFSKDYDVLSLLNGKKILVLGNHDPNPKALG